MLFFVAFVAMSLFMGFQGNDKERPVGAIIFIGIAIAYFYFFG
jgi:hypothetical protein